MKQRAQPTPQRARGRKLLPALAALLLAGFVHGAPPAKPGANKEKPGPLFERFGGVQAPELAASCLGSSFTPSVGPLDVLFALHAGETPELNKVWSLAGPMTRPRDRTRVGCGTLFLTGFSPAPAAVLGELAVLQAGEQAECWHLRNTDVVRPIPSGDLDMVKDGWMAPDGTPEAKAYADFVTAAYYTSEKAFERAARRDLSYANLFNEPRKYRGDVVWIEGRLKRVRHFSPPRAAGEGVSELYEAWLMNDAAGYSNPFVVVFTELPPGVGPAEKINDLPVGFAGYFFKKYRYKAADSKAGQAREAPMLIGHSIRVLQAPAPPPDDTEWAHYLVPVFLGVVGLTAVTVVGLTFWLRRGDHRARERLLKLRQGSFVEPVQGDEGNASVPLRPSEARPVTHEEKRADVEGADPLGPS